MTEQEPEARDLATILEDVKTIKAILQNQDAPLPPVWRLIYFFAFPGLLLIAALKFFVPELSVMPFADTVLWLWLPVMLVVAALAGVRISYYLKTTGTRFMAQSRIQIFLYTRMILVPAVLTLGYLLSLTPLFSMDGAMAVLVAVGVTQVTVVLPRVFRVAPVLFLVWGWTELLLNLRGPIWTLVNTLAVAGTLFWVASLLKQGEDRGEAR